MNCWKTINLSRDYGFQRVILLSCLTMFFAFIIFYMPFIFVYSTIDLKDDGFAFFLILLFLLVPLHKILHALPFWLAGKKVSCKVKWYLGILPLLTIRANYVLTRNFCLMIFLTPFLVITTIFLAGWILVPTYLHYFSLLAAIHLGLCVPDFIYAKQIICAPRASMVEELEDGYHILIKN